RLVCSCYLPCPSHCRRLRRPSDLGAYCLGDFYRYLEDSPLWLSGRRDLGAYCLGASSRRPLAILRFRSS
ncbi:hypothetical protein ACJX0J_017161, partial [Zea mays]